MPQSENPYLNTLPLSHTAAFGIPSSTPRFSLLVYHRHGVEVVPLVEGRAVVVGREAPSDVRVSDRSLSRQHARFEVRDGRVSCEDLGSTNAVRVNGTVVTKSPVQIGDEVFLGSVRVALHALAPFEDERRAVASHDHFVSILEEDLTRHRTFGRQLGLVLVHAAATDAQLHRFCPRIRRLLRPVDNLALYGSSGLEIAVPEATADSLRSLARTIVSGSEDEPPLRCGMALFPDAGTSVEELIEVARGAVQRTSATEPWVLVDGTSEPAPVPGGIVALAPAMREVMDSVRRVALSSIPVLICGETGTGKEVIARAIHEGSPRRQRPLRCVNCGAIPQSLVESILFGHERGAFTGADRRRSGVFEEADGGTVLLDEIGELPPSAQAALLRVLETKCITRVGANAEIQVDVRILAATHRHLEAMCEVERFRWDLLYRLNTMTLHIPPLRERTEEVEALAELFLREAMQSGMAPCTQVSGIAADALAQLLRYTWPGNVRELRNVIHRAAVMARGELVSLEDLPERLLGSSIAEPPVQRKAGETSEVRHVGTLAADVRADSKDDDVDCDFRTRVQRYETRVIQEGLEQSGWVLTETAKRLRIPIRTLTHKIRALGIKRPEEASSPSPEARAVARGAKPSPRSLSEPLHR